MNIKLQETPVMNTKLQAPVININLQETPVMN